MIWLYWENKNSKLDNPDLVNKCIETIKKHSKDVTVLNEKNINDYIETINCSNIYLKIAQKADYYRAKILYTYGGIWLDIDTILLDSIDYLYDELLNSDKDIMVSTSVLEAKKPSVCIAYLVAKPKNIIFKKWVERCEKLIKTKCSLGWADLGGFSLAKVILDNKFQSKIISFPNEITFRFGYRYSHKYYNQNENFVNNTINKIKKDNNKIIILYGTSMYHKKIPQKSVLDCLFNLD